ncbi:MAG: hypothetical protein O7H39_08670 [Gammaproteobacteria bacterium]|nr:hypothetical protein [Gammaproteobacteria bacterium]
MHTLLFYEPGHFHAALCLRISNSRVSEDVHLYARQGPELEAFLSLVQAFNQRADAPTRWRVHVHESSDLLAALIDERRGDAVILAGRNDGKLETIARLHEAGLPVLADKPWLTDASALPHLDTVTSGGPLAMDIMTGRYGALARVRRLIVAREQLFGGFVTDHAEGFAIEIGSKHHLYKIVNGRPLRRPAWYYDVAVQGDGMVDIHSHMIDQVQWLVAGEVELDYERDFRLTTARRWQTPVPLDLYRESTGEAAFPASVEDAVSDDVLALSCNGAIEHALLGVSARQHAEWSQREPEGGGDLQSNVVRGRRVSVQMRHGPETGFAPELHVVPAPGEDVRVELEAAVDDWQEAFPGIGLEPSSIGFRLTWPAGLDGGHETHFALMLDEFLDYLDAGVWPAALLPRIRSRYTLLARARELSLQGPNV